MTVHDAVGVPQRVEGMVGGRSPGRNSGNHGGSGIWGGKAILEDECEFAAAVWDVFGSAIPQSTDAFLECQQTGIDVGTFGPALGVVRRCVIAPLTSGQIDQGQFAVHCGAGIGVAGGASARSDPTTTLGRRFP